ncbi:MAG TPA: YceI family protein [Gemmatimonadaceae bacterium]|nr:YceI family protein [Gemmatimonadaceae bacterium]
MTHRIVGMAPFLVAVATSIAWVQLDPPLRIQPASTLVVAGTSTLRSFECRAKTLNAKVESATTDAVSAVLVGEKGVASVEFTVPSADLDCGNGTMNNHMLKALKATEFKTIAFTLASYEMRKDGDTTRAQMLGTLSLSGTQKSITLDATAVQGPDGTLRMTGAYQLNMKDYGIKPPTLMLGTLRVGEKVTVKFDLLLKP